jgi:hypothetical protein
LIISLKLKNKTIIIKTNPNLTLEQQLQLLCEHHNLLITHL